MEETNTETKDKILDAMWRGDLSVKPEKVEEPQAVQDGEKTDVGQKESPEDAQRRKDALEHLFSGLAFRARTDD